MGCGASSIAVAAPPRKELECSKPSANPELDVCPICINSLPADPSCRTALACEHEFCKTCISKWLGARPDGGCPTCRSDVVPIWTVDDAMARLLARAAELTLAVYKEPDLLTWIAERLRVMDLHYYREWAASTRASCSTSSAAMDTVKAAEMHLHAMDRVLRVICGESVPTGPPCPPSAGLKHAISTWQIIERDLSHAPARAAAKQHCPALMQAAEDDPISLFEALGRCSDELGAVTTKTQFVEVLERALSSPSAA